MFALVVAERVLPKEVEQAWKPDVFFCGVNHDTIDEFVAAIGERLNIDYQSRVAVYCEGVGPVSTCTTIDSLIENIRGTQMKFLIKFAQKTEREGIFYAPVIKPKKCREFPRFSHKKFFESAKMRSGFGLCR